MATEIRQKIGSFFGALEKYVVGDNNGVAYNIGLTPTKRGSCELGQQFVVTNPTPGTGILRPINAAFADTIALFVIQNTSAKGGPNIYVDHLRLLESAMPTATTVMHFATFVDSISRAPAVLTNALQYQPVPLNKSVGVGSVANVFGFPASAAVMTIPAKSGNCRQVGRFSIPTSLGIAGDEYLVQFGGVDHSPSAPLTAVRATAAAKFVVQAPELCIAPGEFGVINQWWLTEATNGETIEFELGWTEKQP